MKYLKTARLMAWLTVPVLALGACGDRDEPTGPVPVTSLDARKIKSSTTVTVAVPTLTRTRTDSASGWGPVKRNQPADEGFAEQVFNKSGGRLVVGNVLLRIPQGALKKNTLISMQVVQGEEMYVLFWPHGLKFDRPVKLGFAIDDTDANEASESDVAGVYFESLYEEVPTMLERFGVSRNGNWMLFDINHFSYYSLYRRRGYTAAGAD